MLRVPRGAYLWVISGEGGCEVAYNVPGWVLSSPTAGRCCCAQAGAGGDVATWRSRSTLWAEEDVSHGPRGEDIPVRVSPYTRSPLTLCPPIPLLTYLESLRIAENGAAAPICGWAMGQMNGNDSGGGEKEKVTVRWRAS